MQKEVNVITPVDSSEFDGASKGFIFNVANQSSHSGIVTLLIGVVTLRDVLIDSGGASNGISVTTWEKLKRQSVRVSSQRKSARKLFA